MKANRKPVKVKKVKPIPLTLGDKDYMTQKHHFLNNSLLALTHVPLSRGNLPDHRELGPNASSLFLPRGLGGCEAGGWSREVLSRMVSPGPGHVGHCV